MKFKIYLFISYANLIRLFKSLVTSEKFSKNVGNLIVLIELFILRKKK